LPLLVIEHGPNVPVARLGEWLVEAGAVLDIRRADLAHEIPSDLQGFSGLVVMGGKMGWGDDSDAVWLPSVRALLGVAVRDRVPTLGVCLGAQMLAAATGGRVARMAEPELGAQLVAKRSAAASDPLFRALPIAPDVLQWHYDEVVDLPPTATLLASSPVCANQAFRVGTLAWGIQFHIETTPQIVADWAVEDADQLPEVDIDAVLARVASIDDDLIEVWRPFAHAFVDVVRDPVSLAPRGGLQMAAPRVTTAEPITDPAQIRAALAAEMQAARGTHGH
jgi:GMP synthase-like glutamine amidotransferase